MSSYLISDEYGPLKKSNHRDFSLSYKVTSPGKKQKDVSTLIRYFAVISSVQLMHTAPSSTAQPQNVGKSQHGCARFIESIISHSCI